MTLVAAIATTQASKPFFAARGYVATQRNTVVIEGEWLANTSMEKQLSEGLAS